MLTRLFADRDNLHVLPLVGSKRILLRIVGWAASLRLPP